MCKSAKNNLEIGDEGRTGNEGGHKKRIMKTSKIKFSLLKYFNKMSLIIHAFGGKLPLHSG